MVRGKVVSMGTMSLGEGLSELTNHKTHTCLYYNHHGSENNGILMLYWFIFGHVVEPTVRSFIMVSQISHNLTNVVTTTIINNKIEKRTYSVHLFNQYIIRE